MATEPSEIGTETTRLDDVSQIPHVMGLVIDDTHADAASLDGLAFNGLSVGTQFGNMLAMINACATSIQIIASALMEEQDRRDAGD